MYLPFVQKSDTSEHQQRHDRLDSEQPTLATSCRAEGESHSRTRLHTRCKRQLLAHPLPCRLQCPCRVLPSTYSFMRSPTDGVRQLGQRRHRLQRLRPLPRARRHRARRGVPAVHRPPRHRQQHPHARPVRPDPRALPRERLSARRTVQHGRLALRPCGGVVHGYHVPGATAELRQARSAAAEGVCVLLPRVHPWE